LCCSCCFFILGDDVRISDISVFSFSILFFRFRIFSFPCVILLLKFSWRTSSPARSALRSDISRWRTSCSLLVDDWICLLMIRILSWSLFTWVFFS